MSPVEQEPGREVAKGFQTLDILVLFSILLCSICTGVFGKLRITNFESIEATRYGVARRRVFCWCAIVCRHGVKTWGWDLVASIEETR